jgi:hypothetical protein
MRPELLSRIGNGSNFVAQFMAERETVPEAGKKDTGIDVGDSLALK